MTWIAQLGHVVAKDIRQARWSFLVYAILVAGITISALHVDEPTKYSSTVSTAIIVIFGIMVVAWLVQDDSPSRADAFWASRPFYPSGVLTAKALLALGLLIGVPAIGQAVALSSNGVAGRFLPGLVLQSAGLYALWLLVAMVVAAMTRDIPRFVVTFLMIITALAMLSSLCATTTAGEMGTDGVSVVTVVNDLPSRGTLMAIAFAGIAGAIALLAFMYRTHDNRRWVKVACALAAMCVLTSANTGVVQSHGDLNAGNPPKRTAASSGTGLHIALPSEPLNERGDLRVPIMAPTLPDSESLEVTQATAIVYSHGAAPFMASLRSQFELRPATGPSSRTLRWLGAVSERSEHPEAAVALSVDQRKAIAAGIDSIILEGTVARSAPRVRGMTPLTRGARSTVDGNHVRVDSLSTGRGDVSAVVSTTWIPTGGNDAVLGPFAIVNAARGEAIRVTRTSVGMNTRSFVLPGPEAWRQVTYLQLPGARTDPVASQIDEAWLRSAKLMLVDWVVLDKFRTRLTAAAPH